MLRRPLCSVMGLTTLLEEGSTEEKIKEYLPLLATCTRELYEIIQKTSIKIEQMEDDYANSLDIPEPLTTSLGNSKQLIPKHFDHINLLIIGCDFPNCLHNSVPQSARNGWSNLPECPQYALKGFLSEKNCKEFVCLTTKSCSCRRFFLTVPASRFTKGKAACFKSTLFSFY
jgi:hypothetical protein